MSIRKREGNRPDRRILPPEATTDDQRRDLAARLRYVGSANHKLRPGDYGFVPTHSPRPSKSPCDALRPVRLAEAQALFERGIFLGMVSRIEESGIPKYVWSVDRDGEVYEAKTHTGQGAVYHGYRLGDDDRLMRRHVLEQWNRRCQPR